MIIVHLKLIRGTVWNTVSSITSSSAKWEGYGYVATEPSCLSYRMVVIIILSVCDTDFSRQDVHHAKRTPAAEISEDFS